ncbi:MAG: hypothetical protein Q8R67_02475 [Rhodoferax sp.]|nr:hypothetical protein [Rhodoferax sp.]MDP3650526.1 hypothetical protein [Rhodoferax sp.]
MSTPNATGFQVGADINPFEAAMRRIVQAAKGGQTGVADELGKITTGPLAGLKVAFAAISGLLAGGFMQAAISETAQMTESAMDLGRALGVSTNEAKTIQIAMEDIGATTGEYEAASKKMALQLKENEAEMNQMGLATRDAAGNLRPMNELMADGIKVLGTYKEGTDRVMASQVLFSRGIDASSKLMLYNQQVQDDARQTMEEMGLTVGGNAVAAWQDYDAAMDKAGFGMQGMKKAIGDSLMPVMTTLVNMFNSVMPAAIVVVRGALSGLTAGFLYVKNGVLVLWESIQLMLYSVLEPLRGLTEALGRAMVGDFSGAVSAFKGMGTNMANAWSGSLDRMAEDSRKTAEQVYALFARDDQAGSGGGPGAGDRNYKGKDKDKDKPLSVKVEQAPKEPTAMPTYEAALNERKLAFERENALREFSKQQEIDYWREILSTHEVGSKDRTAIALKTGKLELDILRQSAKEKREIQQLHAEDHKAETLGFVAELEARAAFERDMGTTTQADYLARQASFNQMRLQAEMEFVQQKIEVANLDPESNIVALEQLEIQKLEIKRKYKALEADLGRQQALESTAQQRNMFSSIRSGFESSMAGMIQGTLTLNKGLQAVWNSVLQSFSQFIAKKVVAWALGETAQTTATVAGNAVRTESDWFAAAQSVAANVWSAIKNIAIKAWEVAASVYSALASIPYVGPFIAPVAAIAATGVVMGFAANIASASGGYDIPAGIDPLTQLHEQEMVLPAKHANVIRSLADQGPGQGGGSSGASAPPIHIHGSPNDTIKMKDLAVMMKRMGRNAVFV